MTSALDEILDSKLAAIFDVKLAPIIKSLDFISNGFDELTYEHDITPRRERALAVERWEQYEWESLPLLPSYSILATLQSELKAFPLDEVQIFTYGWRNKLFSDQSTDLT